MPDPARSAADDGADLTEHVLADRLAAVVIRREPGYSLPRRTVLARRFEASAGQMDAAIEELVRRQLVRRLPTGELRRAGPVDYVLSLDGLPGLSSFVDPMEHRVSCTAVRSSRRPASANVAEALHLKPGTVVHTRRCLWTADDEPAATSVTYVLDEYARLIPPTQTAAAGAAARARPSLARELGWPLDRSGTVACPGAVRIEIQPPPRSIARRLRLTSGAPAVMVTARLDAVRTHSRDGSNSAETGPQGVEGQAVALALLALRPDLFRVVLDTRGDRETTRSPVA